MGKLTLMGAGGGGDGVSYVQAHINRDSAGNDTIDLQFDGPVVGADLVTGVTIEVSGDSGVSYVTLDLSATDGGVITDTDYIRYTCTGTVTTFQGGHSVRVSISGASANLNNVSNDTDLTNNSTVNVLEGGVAAYNFDSLLVDSINGYNLTNVNSVTQTTGTYGNAALFDDTLSQVLQKSDNADLSGGNVHFYIHALLLIDDVTKQNQIVCKWDGPANNGEYVFDYIVSTTPDQFRFLVTPDGTPGALTSVLSGAAATQDQDYDVICYHDPDRDVIGIIVDDASPVETAHTTGIHNDIEDLTLGNGSNTPPATFLSGELAHVYICKPTDAWTAAEITSIQEAKWPFSPDHL
tara:strand:+ start:14 stop:1066 length:1053 start_codon:yes stop_codon:yes gene_type:complete